ncbi:uncharacterized protein KY384_003851 [Bacidia gigantensis]|uniref:uncharacterized protein n=1 Tax=Bacidia gigantensis TaxID=2732470 RepID=UPI001D046640|nr:uncharacterized protein KY384_003851 [Bacidia gigantensis]KAG8532210.1 hypothetical protein KY384_003851 [Bacidia gigantensis]
MSIRLFSFHLPLLLDRKRSMGQIGLHTKESFNGEDFMPVSTPFKGAIQKADQAPSDSDSESTSSVDRVSHATNSSQVDSQVGDGLNDPKEVLEGTFEDENWERVSDFACNITGAARNALLNRKHVEKVVAVITYWETSNKLEHLRKHADQLSRHFKDSFKFDVLVYKIPDNITDLDFVGTIGGELKKVLKDPDSLFILYYGGHASMKELSTERSWKKEQYSTSPEIEWSSAMRILFKKDVVCSTLFIFDCCHAGGMIDQTLPWNTSCELLGACAADVQASLEISSFTKAVLEEVSNNTYDVWELHAALCDTDKRRHHNLKEFPYYTGFIGHDRPPTSTLIKKVGSHDGSEDRPRTSSDMLARLETISDAVICIAVTFKCTAEVFMKEFEAVEKDWRRWFRFAPTQCDDIIVKACRGKKLIAAFDSNSCITIWSFPVWLWDAMTPLKGYQQIGIIRPQNLALAAANAQPDLAVPDPSSNMATGEIPEGERREDDACPESTNPLFATSMKAETMLKLPIKSLLEQSVTRDTSNFERRRNRFSSAPYKKS